MCIPDMFIIIHIALTTISEWMNVTMTFAFKPQTKVNATWEISSPGVKAKEIFLIHFTAAAFLNTLDQWSSKQNKSRKEKKYVLQSTGQPD